MTSPALNPCPASLSFATKPKISCRLAGVLSISVAQFGLFIFSKTFQRLENFNRNRENNRVRLVRA